MCQILSFSSYLMSYFTMKEKGSDTETVLARQVRTTQREVNPPYTLLILSVYRTSNSLAFCPDHDCRRFPLAVLSSLNKEAVLFLFPQYAIDMGMAASFPEHYTSYLLRMDILQATFREQRSGSTHMFLLSDTHVLNFVSYVLQKPYGKVFTSKPS